MECTGTLQTVTKDWLTNKVLMTFAIDDSLSNEDIESVRGLDKLRIKVTKWKKKRSLDANAYYWTLLTKLAKVVGTSNSEMHNQLLAEYGFPEVVGGQLIRTPIPDTEEAERMVMKSTTYHLKPTTQIVVGKDGVSYRTYTMIRGSSSYNTEEMSRLINGLIYECKCEHIPDSEIATPEEKRILIERYGVNV